MATYSAKGYPINSDRLSRTVNAVLKDHAPFEHHSETAWCLWMCKQLHLTLSDESIALISNVHSSVCALLFLDLHASGRLGKSPDFSYWKKNAESETALDGDLWLLSYEAGIRGWGGFDNQHILNHPYFSLLKNAGIHFYNESRTLKPTFELTVKTSKSGIGIERLQSIFDSDELRKYIDFDEEDGGYENAVVFYDNQEELPF